MGELINWTALFLQLRDANMRRRAKRGVNSERCASVVTLPIVKTFEQEANIQRQLKRTHGSREVMLRPAWAVDIPRAEVDLRCSHGDVAGVDFFTGTVFKPAEQSPA